MKSFQSNTHGVEYSSNSLSKQTINAVKPARALRSQAGISLEISIKSLVFLTTLIIIIIIIII